MRQPLPLPYHPQKAEGYCLAACAQMVLHYWGTIADQDKLSGRLGVIAGVGVPASRITQLASHQISVIYDVGEWGSLITWLDRGVPVTAMVQAGGLTYWQDTEFAHAVVVAGYDATHV